jgi:hypothetical protein
MLLGATFELIDLVEIALMVAIPVILIVLLVRSFKGQKVSGDAP